MEVILSIMCVTFGILIGQIVFDVGVLPSISDYWYKAKAEYGKFIFSLSLLIMGVCFIALTQHWIGFLAGGLIAGVGAAPLFKKKAQSILHVVAAIGGIGLGFIYLVARLLVYIPTLIAIAILGVLKLMKIKNCTFWVEVVAAVVLMILSGIYLI